LGTEEAFCREPPSSFSALSRNPASRTVVAKTQVSSANAGSPASSSRKQTLRDSFVGKVLIGCPPKGDNVKATTEIIVGKDVDEYLMSVSKGSREALERLRKTIRAAAPGAVERISYRMPVFYYHGPLVGFAAFKDHCSFFVMSPSVMNKFKEELKALDTSKGTVRFTWDKPLNVSLVKKLVKARKEENEAKVKKRRPRSSVKS